MPSLMVPGRIFAAVYDRLNAEVEQEFGAKARPALLAPLHGAVLEIGAGTGVNIEHYPATVERLVLTEPDRHMRERLRTRLAGSGRAAEVVDAAVATLVLCTVPDQAAALREVVRVLRPGGRLVFAEHVRSERPRKARMQDAVRPIWQVLARGCHPNRDTLAAITAAGLVAEDVERVIVPKIPSLAHEAIVGSARKPA